MNLDTVKQKKLMEFMNRNYLKAQAKDLMKQHPKHSIFA